MAFAMQFSFAQEKTISGTVSDASGPVPGVNVVVKGSTRSVQTDFDGKFVLQARTGEILVFSYLGMNNSSVTVGASNTVYVKLTSSSQALDEVVVIGYGTQKKKDLTSSISSIDGDDIKGLVTPSFESQLAGRAAGVQVTASTGIVGQAPKVRIRGTASISSGTDPLYVVDGMPMYSGDIGGQANTNALGDINPNDIESFEVLKDGAATAIYGSRAANGVILITTKKGKKGAMNVNYSAVTGFASATKTFDLLGTPDFLVIANDKLTNRGLDAAAVGSANNDMFFGKCNFFVVCHAARSNTTTA